MKPYRDLNSYLREQFGQKVYKISLSTPFTCPNRDGTVGTGGCLFCSAEGSGNFAASANVPVSLQLQEAKKRVAAKMKEENPLYIAYFQSFTSTYGPIETQRALFTEAISDPQVAVLSLATRPDCVGDEVVALLSELNQIKPVWIELGLQTSHEKTAKLIRRGYENAVFEDAVARLSAAGISVIVHLILGLPGEGHEDEIETVRYLSRFPVDGVKFHLLHVLRGADLSHCDYVPLSMEEYVERVTDLLCYLPPRVVVHRLTGDGDKKELIAPLWSGNKKKVLNAITAALAEKKIRQGSRFYL